MTEQSPERIETPVLGIEDFIVAFHIAATRRGRPEPETDVDREGSPSPLRSYERDMLSYAYRDTGNLSTTVLRSSELPDNGCVKIGFPSRTEYESDTENESERNDRVSICRSGKEGAVTLRAAITEFKKSNISILHIILSSFQKSAGSEESLTGYDLDEYDLIKLIKLWEGGEGQPDPGSSEEDLKAKQKEIPHFFVGDGDPLSLRQLADMIFKHQFRFAARVGTVEVVLSPDRPASEDKAASQEEGTIRSPDKGDAQDGKAVQDKEDKPAHWFFEGLRLVREDRAAFEEYAKDLGSSQLVAVGGVVQGLLDFDEIDTTELADVFEGFAEDGRCIYEEGISITGFHKGTLLQIKSGKNRDSPVGLSAYLLVPQAVLLHNDDVLRQSAECSSRLADVRNAGRRERLRNSKLRIAKTQEDVEKQRALLSHLMVNVFNYVSERTLFRAGQEVRGLDDREREMQQRLSDDSQQLEARLKRRDTYSAVAAFVLTIAGALGITGSGHMPTASSWLSITLLAIGTVLIVVVVVAYIFIRLIS